MHRDCCKDDATTPAFTMAFQPVVDLVSGDVYAYEALARAVRHDGEPQGAADEVLSQVGAHNRHAFDQACRTKAIALAAKLGLRGFLSINLLPKAVRDPAACLGGTLHAAALHGFPLHRIIFEVPESEPVRDPAHLHAIFAEYRNHGLLMAVDDFGAGHGGLNLLAELQPDIVKLDLNLTRGVHEDRARRAIVKSVIAMCEELRITVIAEGVEHRDEVRALLDLRVRLFQGHLFARAAVEALPPVDGDIVDGLSVTQEMRRPAFAR